MSTGKRALISGITGQDGSYLAELLLEKGYEVHGIIRRSASFNTDRLDHIYQDPHDKGARLFLHYGDLNDGASLATIIRNTKPTEVYNLGAQSHVRVSFDNPVYTADTVASALKPSKPSATTSSSAAIRSTTSFIPRWARSGKCLRPRRHRSIRSPYSCAKVCAH